MSPSSDVPAFLHAFSRPSAGREAYVTIVRGEGAVVWDDLGNRYVDALASLWYCNVGHGRMEIVDAVTEQMRNLAAFHTFDRFTNEPAEQLTTRLAAMAPMPGARVFLTSGGSESVDTAIKLARLAHHVGGAPERRLVISRKPSYHGTTYAAMTATGLPLNQDGYGPLVPDMVQVPYDDLGALDDVLAEQGHELCAIIAEPVVGAGGVYPPPPGYLDALRDRCDRHGAFLILDEVITGFGRLGRWWGSERFEVVPDLVTFAKGVTSGYQPVGGVLVGQAVRERLEADPGLLLRHGHTYGGHPTACAAGMANLDIIEREDLVERSVEVGDRLRGALEAVVDGEHVTSVRGDGAMWAAGLGSHVNAVEVRDEMLFREVIARPIGMDSMAFCPPYVMTDADIDQCASAFAEAVAVVAAKG
jgi:adenosylmethionine-8-amino-7-oxononanoate aminotransferase